jgi:intracellular sulfur oxidation DsrE/DsrF family protein
VKLEKANIVFDIGSLVPKASGGTRPLGIPIRDIVLLAADFSDWNVEGHIIAVFHGDAAYLVLNDDSYNANRHVQTGNPVGKLIAGLMKQGVQIELCGATAEANHWTNADLLPGVKVDTKLSWSRMGSYSFMSNTKGLLSDLGRFLRRSFADSLGGFAPCRQL